MMWKTLNELLNKPTKNTKLSKSFLESNSSNTIIEPEEIANKFNDYFTNIGPNLAKKIKCNDISLVFSLMLSQKMNLKLNLKILSRTKVLDVMALMLKL
jgi:hypothetical protein